MGFDGSQVTGVGSEVKAGGKRVGAKFAAVIRRGALDLQRTAQVKAPVDTGDLRASISTTITGDGRFGSITAEIGPTVEYGLFVETGTSRMGPQPYLAPAFDERIGAIEAAVVKLGGELFR